PAGLAPLPGLPPLRRLLAARAGPRAARPPRLLSPARLGLRRLLPPRLAAFAGGPLPRGTLLGGHAHLGAGGHGIAAVAAAAAVHHAFHADLQGMRAAQYAAHGAASGAGIFSAAPGTPGAG